MTSGNFSEFIVYVDESGDHSLISVDPQFPVFVLAFCIFRKDDYTTLVTRAIQQFKFKYFGHDIVVLHEREIRKAEGPFSILMDSQLRGEFLADLSGIMSSSPFSIIAACVDKGALRGKRGDQNVYNLALGSCLQRLYKFLGPESQESAPTHVVVEKRGKKEDAELELEFRRFCEDHDPRIPFKVVFANKQINSCGLQLADLVARPIGRHYLNADQRNRAFEILAPKFAHTANRQLGFEIISAS